MLKCEKLFGDSTFSLLLWESAHHSAHETGIIEKVFSMLACVTHLKRNFVEVF